MVCKALRELALAFLFSLIIAGLFFPQTLQGRMLYSADLSGSDLSELNIPMRYLAAESIKKGELPFWTDKIACGMPLLAEGQAGVFYPTTLAFFGLFSPETASNLSVITTFCLACTGAFWLGRRRGLSWPAAALAGLVFGFGPNFIFRFKHLNMIQVAAWLPWSLVAYHYLDKHLQAASHLKTWREWWPRLIWPTAGLALIWTIQILAGHPHVAYICGLASLGGGWLMTLSPTSPSALKTWQKTVAILLISLAALLLSLLWSAPQLWPTYELVEHSQRSQVVSWETLSNFPFKPSHLLRLFNPYFDGNPALGTYDNDHLDKEGVFWETSPYIGLVPLGLAILALIKANKRVYLTASAALLCLWLALGTSGGLYALLWQGLPGFNLFRFPARFLIPYALFAALLAGWGLEKLLQLPYRHWPSSFKLTIAAVLLLLSGADLLFCADNYVSYLPSQALQLPPTSAFLGEHNRINSLTAQLIWTARRSKQGWRGHEAQTINDFALMPPNLTALWGIPQSIDRALWEGGLSISRYKDWQFAIYNTLDLAVNEQGQMQVKIAPEALNLLALQNVSHIISAIPMVGSNLQATENITLLKQWKAPDSPDSVYIYRINNCLPRFRLVKTAFPELTDTPTSLNLLAGQVFDHERLAMLNDPQTSNSSAPAEVPGDFNLKVLETSDQCIKLQSQAPQVCYAVIADSTYPGWQAWLDGQATPIYTCNYAFRAVKVPAGKHQVTLHYVPTSFYQGVVAGLVGLLLFGILAVIAGRSSSGHSSAE